MFSGALWMLQRVNADSAVPGQETFTAPIVQSASMPMPLSLPRNITTVRLDGIDPLYLFYVPVDLKVRRPFPVWLAPILCLPACPTTYDGARLPFLQV